MKERELFNLLLRDLHIEISEKQIFGPKTRITVKLKYHIDGEFKEIASDYIDIDGEV